jgi:hypothetical protein
LQSIKNSDSSLWPSQFPASVNAYFSALGTTRSAAGGFEQQWKIDFDLNLELAKAAKAKGVQTYVLISSNGASASSRFGYMKMKGQLEDEVAKLGFDHCVILRPGLIVGKRSGGHSPAEAPLRWIAEGLGAIHNMLKDSWAQDATVIGRAAVAAGLQCIEGQRTEKGVWLLGGADIIRLGREGEKH